MPQDEIIWQNEVLEMAKQAGALGVFRMPSQFKLSGNAALEAFAKLVAAKEREACASICDDKHHTWRWDNEPDSSSGPRDCAQAIRARGETQ